jgi:hypothetical protein
LLAAFTNVFKAINQAGHLLVCSGALNHYFSLAIDSQHDRLPGLFQASDNGLCVAGKFRQRKDVIQVSIGLFCACIALAESLS